MPNERLRDAILRTGLTPSSWPTSIGVDPKTVERWITQDRMPYPRTGTRSRPWCARASVPVAGRADAGADDAGRRVGGVAASTRGARPSRRLMATAARNGPTKQIGILAYAGLFLPSRTRSRSRR